jgi:hypothetical protein
MINSISPQNTFTTSQQQIINFLIDMISKEDNDILRKKDYGIMLLAIASILGNVDLMAWILNNKYAGVNDFIENKHMQMLLQLGFDFKVYSKAF